MTILDPNFHNLQGYENAVNGCGCNPPAGTNDVCVAAYHQGYREGIEEMTCDPDEQHIDEIDNGDDYDWGDDEDGETEFFDDDQGQYDDDPSPYSGY